MEKLPRKGFTIVELIIVIAVIGILAAILIPVFSGVIDKANSKSAMSDARNSLTNYIIELIEDGVMPENIVLFVQKAGKYYAYGYQKITNEFVESDRNPIKAKDVGDLVGKYNMTFDPDFLNYVEAREADPESADTQGKVFSLVPKGYSSDFANVKGNEPTKSGEMTLDDVNNQFTCLDSYIPEDSLLVGTTIYHGYLLSGYVEGSGDDYVPPRINEPVTRRIEYDPGYIVSESGAITDFTGNVTGIPMNVDVIFDQGGERSYTIPGMIPMSDGYVFDGWQMLSADGSTLEGEIYSPNNQIMVNESFADVTVFYARWIPIPKYTLTINATGNLGATPNNADYYPTQQLESGVDIKPILAPAFNGTYALTDPSGMKEFIGWEITSDTLNITMTSESIAQPGSYVITSNTTATAKWGSKTGTLTFVNELENVNYDPAFTLPSTQTFNYGEAITLGDSLAYNGTAKSTVAPDYTRYALAGWKLYAENGSSPLTQTIFTAGSEIPSELVTGNLVLKAEWSSYYQLTYGLGNGPSTANADLPPMQEYLAGSSVYTSDKWIIGTTKYTVSGTEYTFNGWFIVKADGTTATLNGGVIITANAPAGNMNAVAQWQAVTQNRNVEISFYDEWNGVDMGNSFTIQLPGSKTSVALSELPGDIAVPEYMVALDSSFTDIWNRQFTISNGKAVIKAIRMTTIANEDYVCLTNQTGLLKVRDYLTRNYILLNDITISGNVQPLGWDTDGGWGYAGTFNGNGKTIYNWQSISANIGSHNAGLFAGLSSSGVVKHLTMSNVRCTMDYLVGGICGDNNGTIIDCHVTNSTINCNKDSGGNGYMVSNYSTNNYGTFVGGICGGNRGSVINCTVSNSYIGRRSTDTSMLNNSYGLNGGITGCNKGTIRYCEVKNSSVGTIGMSYSPTTYARVGGLVGQNNDIGTVEHCRAYNTGVGGYGMVGGLVGANFGTCQYLFHNSPTSQIAYGTLEYVSFWVGTEFNSGTNRYIICEGNTQTVNSTYGVYFVTTANLKSGNVPNMTSVFGSNYWVYTSGAYPSVKTWSQINGTTDYWNN